MTASMTRFSAATVLHAAVGLACLLGPLACKDGATEVRKSCDTRAAWTKAVTKKCTNCLAKSAIPKCNSSCTDKEYSGKCDDEGETARKEPTCEGVDRCLHECPRNDCACEEKCYEGKARCKELSGIAQACVTSVCDEWCR